MLIILDKKTNKVINNLGTNSLFPDGNVPITENENERYIRLVDDSDFSKKILLAYDYELELSESNELIDVIVHKTLEQYNAENPSTPQQPTEIEVLKKQVQQQNEAISDLTMMIAMAQTPLP